MYILIISTFFFSLILTASIRFFANKKELLDHPNERSSHSTPTPKGGGLGILIVFYVVLSYLFNEGLVEVALFYATLTALPVILISLIDDIYELSAKIRFSVQFISACGAIYFLGGVNSFDFSIYNLSGIWLNIVALVFILWLTNLYNFLDGLDGYAASETVFIGISVFLLFQNIVGFYLGIAALGFLVFNWPKASLFMGDVGSASIGFILSILVLYDAGSFNFLAWIILLSLFWFDATITLFRRFLNKEKLSQAHKKHMYQRLHQAGWSHQKVLVSSIVFNLLLFISLWLVPVENYIYLLGSTILILFVILKYIDSKKGFE